MAPGGVCMQKGCKPVCQLVREDNVHISGVGVIVIALQACSLEMQACAE